VSKKDSDLKLYSVHGSRGKLSMARQDNCINISKVELIDALRTEHNSESIYRTTDNLVQTL
jgi:hypothetical protein